MDTQPIQSMDPFGRPLAGAQRPAPRAGWNLADGLLAVFCASSGVAALLCMLRGHGTSWVQSRNTCLLEACKSCRI
jgi:hypothetical protein